MITVHPPELRRDQGQAYLHARIEGSQAGDELWYAVADEYADALAVGNPDAFVISLVPVAMEAGQDITVRGALSERLFYNLTNYYMPILERVLPRLHPVRIHADELARRGSPAGKAVVTGFSGGVDSFAAVADHFLDTVPEGYRLTQLLFNDVGSHGAEGIGRRAFETRQRTVREAAEALGLPLITVTSNIEHVIRGRFPETHTLRNIAVAHALQALVGKLLYASGYRYEDAHIHPAHDIACADPVSVHLLSSEGLECIATGSQYSRVEKTERLTGVELTYRFLDVCAQPDTAASIGKRNCTRCMKCIRTLLTLEILGKAELYGEVFDLDRWRRARSRNIGRFLGKRDPLVREVTEFAQRRRFPLPVSARLEGAAWRLARDASIVRRVRAARAARRAGGPAPASSA